MMDKPKKDFDVDNLGLGAIAAISVLALSIFCLWLWLNQKPLDFDGARGLGIDHLGVIHIQVDKTLYRYDRAGNALRNIELSELGVTDFLGDLSFNESNHLLLRPGAYRTGFLENLSVMFRISNKRDPVSSGAQGLSLCDLELMKCSSFGKKPHDFNRGYFSTVDQRDHSFIISDASRHQLHKFDKIGNVLQTRDDGLDFPNGMIVVNDHLYLVDTNNKVVKQLALNNNEFGRLVDSHAITNPTNEKMGHRWPFSITKAGNFWWIIILDDNMNEGGVYLFDEKWQFVKALALRTNATPAAMLSTNDQVLVSDIESTRVQRFSLSGELLGVVEHAALNSRLEELERQRVFFTNLKYVFVLIFFMVIASTIIIIKWYSRNNNAKILLKQTDPHSVLKLDVNKLGNSITWIQPRSLLGSLRSVRRLQIFSLLAVVVIAGCAKFYISSYLDSDVSTKSTDSLLMYLAFAGCTILLLSELARVRVGVYNGKIVLHDQVTNKILCSDGANVLYDGRQIAFGDLSAHAANTIYKLDGLTRHVYPILSEATVIKTDAMRTWKKKNERPRHFDTVIKSALLVLSLMLFIFYDALSTL